MWRSGIDRLRALDVEDRGERAAARCSAGCRAALRQTFTSPFEARSMRSSSEAMCTRHLLARRRVRARRQRHVVLRLAPSSRRRRGPSSLARARRRRRSRRRSRPACMRGQSRWPMLSPSRKARSGCGLARASGAAERRCGRRRPASGRSEVMGSRSVDWNREDSFRLAGQEPAALGRA